MSSSPRPPNESAAHEIREPVSVSDSFICDSHGRVLLLRGVNLAANCKLPVNVPSYLTDESKLRWFDDEHVSFVGRPFVLADAKGHFERLKTWGLTFLRWLVPWEALEHTAPYVASSCSCSAGD